MQLEFPKDVEASIQAKAAAAGFKTVEEFILDRLDLDEDKTNIPTLPHDQWVKKLDAFVKRQVSRNPHFDDSRESIYPVR
ncbi:hypothetical protein SH668x_000060 [Planctomicrobium sp. SH668]|uniref:hypothetical protein n=1 Tax=Planctomicrobium sp. SH668 TaxID=3448126 RepID=UPI003F5B6829